jgi:hydrogenase assembly chaperone HypC/HupF
MCVAVPCEVLQINEGKAEVLYEGGPRWVLLHDIPELAVGDYVTVYAGTVLQRIPPEEAQDVLRLFAELAALEEADDD